jgi:hypothetical protein
MFSSVHEPKGCVPLILWSLSIAALAAVLNYSAGALESCWRMTERLFQKAVRREISRKWPLDDTRFVTAAYFFKVFVFGRFDSALSATRVTRGGHRSKNRYFPTRFH